MCTFDPSPPPVTEPRVRIHVGRQQLLLLDQRGQSEDSWPVSTGLNGTGQQQGSGCTPLGRHRVRIRIGDGCPPGAVFVGRRPTGEIWDAALAASQPNRDWILTRILWLTGCEPGYNRGGSCDTLKRYIYIHGTPDTEPMSRPASHGCVRMRNADLIALFDQVRAGDIVDILP